jgi:Transposase, Mutator family
MLRRVYNATRFRGVLPSPCRYYRHHMTLHGHLPEREIITGIGPVAVRCPRVRDRVGEGSERIRFSSAILPPYARRSKSLEVLIPILYLKGVSTGDFEEALIALLGKDAGGLSASTVGRLKVAWSEEHARWSKRDLSAKRYVYFWADGIHVQARLEDAAQCLLVIIGATPEGRKELVGLIDGVRESAQSWKELLLDLKRRGLTIGPELAVADGALGFWQAIEPKTRGQRCWVGSLKKAPMPDSVLVNDSQLAGARYARAQGAGSTGALHHRIAQAVHSGRARSGARRSRARPVVAAGRSVRLLLPR